MRRGTVWDQRNKVNEGIRKSPRQIAPRASKLGEPDQEGALKERREVSQGCTKCARQRNSEKKSNLQIPCERE